jgi:hypothetical protein
MDLQLAAGSWYFSDISLAVSNTFVKDAARSGLNQNPSPGSGPVPVERHSFLMGRSKASSCKIYILSHLPEKYPISVNGAQEGKKTASLLQNTSNTFPISAVQSYAQTINITGFKNCQKNDDFWWLKIPTHWWSHPQPQRLQLCLSEQQAIGELP